MKRKKFSKIQINFHETNFHFYQLKKLENY